MMNNPIICICIYLLISSSNCDKACSREGSRVVRDYFTRALGPIYEQNHIAVPLECVFSPMRDIFYRQELNKVKVSNDKWLCKYCNKTFYSEYFLDLHFVNRHNNTLLKNEQSVCLADYCPIFRCDVFKRRKRSLKSLNPLARTSGIKQRKTRKLINEQYLNSLKIRCSTLINQCIPNNILNERRIQLQQQMYAEVCVYLTTSKYFELPRYRQPLINFTTIFCVVIFLGMCLVGIGVVTHSDWSLDENEECQIENNVSSQAIPSTNGVISSQTKLSGSLRQRIRPKTSDGECQHLHSHSHNHHHQHM